MVEDIESNSPVECTEVSPAPNLISSRETHQTEIPMGDAVIEEVEQQVEPSSPNKRGLKSIAWKHYRREKIGDKWKAIYKYCDKKLVGETRLGTTHLHDHNRTCPLRTVMGTKQSTLKVVEQTTTSSQKRSESVIVGNYTFSQDVARKELAGMIALHEYPLSIVNHIRFRRYSHSLQPLFKIFSRNTIKSDIMRLYESERSKQIKILAKNRSRIAITTDMWTASNQNKGYMSVMAHYIDDAWTLQDKIIGCIYLPAPQTAEVICEVLLNRLMDWNADRKLSTLTIDNASTNETAIGLLLDKMSSSSFVLGGDLFHMRCCAHILNLIVKDGMSSISKSIENIRDSVSFWVATPKREEIFRDTCHQLNLVYGKKLVLDCKTRWNSTNLMLASALPYQEVFKRLSQCESLYKCLPREDDWKKATEICDKLVLFFKVTELFSGTQYPTLNIYFPKVCEIRLALRAWQTCGSDIIQNMASSMILKFDKYWSMINGVMTIGAILDPRYKMTLLNYLCPLMCGYDARKELERVMKLCQDLVDEYQKRDGIVCPTSSGASSGSASNIANIPQDFWESNYIKYVEENVNTINVKSELTSYFEEPVLKYEKNSEAFDILAWWKQNGLKYPTLQIIGRDFLAIPISSVDSECAFSTGGHVLSPQRSNLQEDTLEALMCTQDWIRKELQGTSKIMYQFLSVGEDEDCEKEAQT